MEETREDHFVCWKREAPISIPSTTTTLPRAPSSASEYSWVVGESLPYSFGFSQAEVPSIATNWTDEASEKHMPARGWFYYAFFV